MPFWVVLACQAAMALGTLMGGWRIVRTMGLRITKLTPMQGFCAETGGAATLFVATFLGVPVSTTHTITGAIVGVGAARRVSAVRWNVASSIVYAWVITIPASAIVAARPIGRWSVRCQVTSFSPAMPATIRPMQASRSAVAGSPNRKMPSSGGSDRADAGPDRIGGSDRQRFHGEPEQDDADGHAAASAPTARAA